MLLQFLTWLFFVFFEWGGMKNFSSLHTLSMGTGQGMWSNPLLKCKGKISISYTMEKVCSKKALYIHWISSTFVLYTCWYLKMID